MVYAVGHAVRFAGVLACLLLLAPIAPAQDGKSPTPKKPLPKPPPSNPKADGSNSYKLIAPDGKTITLSKEDVEELLRRPKALDYAVNSVALEGKADEKRAELTATITVQVLRDGWMLVPLFLNEAVILDTKHEYLGATIDGKPQPGTQGQAAFKDVARQGGYRWWFRGQGYHRLKLTLVVSVVRAVAQRRVRLQLPPLAAASTIRLSVPDPNLIVVPQKGTDTRTKRVGAVASEIRVAGLGSELDLQWRSLPRTKGRAALVRSRTAVFVDFTEESVVLTAVQSIQPLGSGSIDRVVVQLPAGFRAQAASGTFVKSESLRVDARNRATVEFSEPRTERTQVKWTLDRPLPATGGTVSLNGFDVERGRMQTGEIAVARVQGLRVVKSGTGNSVDRIQPSKFSEPDLIRDESLTAVYQFLKQPFQLDLSVSRVQPHVTVDPTIRLKFEKGKQRLSATFRVQVSDDGAEVEELKIRWPGWKTAGWTIEPLAPSQLIDSRELNARNDKEPIILRLAGKRGGTFDVSLSAVRPLVADKPATFRLPVLAATVSRPTTLVVARSSNVDVNVTGAGDQPLTAVPGVPKDLETTRRFRLDNPVAQLTARVKVHAQRIVATTRVELRPTPQRAEWSQRIKMKVDYVPVSAVRLIVPAELEGHVEFFFPDGRKATTASAESMMGKPLVEIRLSRPQMGTIEFDAVCSQKFSTELQPGKPLPFSLPLVQLEGAKYSEIEVRGQATSPIDMQFSPKSWRRLTTRDGTPAWLAEAPGDSVSLKLHYPTTPRSRAFGIRRALVRAATDSGGVTRYRGQYRIVEPPRVVGVKLPAGTHLDGIWWGKGRIDDAVATTDEDDATTLQIPIPTSQGRGLLTIDYHASSRYQSGWIASRALAAPRFPSNVWIEQSAWQVTLPPDEHLSSFGSGFFSEFRWTRSTVFWERHPTDEFANPGEWIDAGDGPDWAAPAQGNVYWFRRYGPASTFSLTSMSRSMIVLLGAGVAWLVGILLVRFRRLRAATVLLTLGLIASAAGLWFATEMQLMLQPALLGMLLVGGYVWIDRIASRRRGPAIITVAHPSDFVINSTQDDQTRAGSSVTGDEGPTTVRGPVPQPVSTTSDVRRPG